jgi:ribonuclease HII
VPRGSAGHRPAGAGKLPDWRLEQDLAARGFRRIAGVDEAGRGPLAGPVVVAAVILPLGWQPPVKVDDSKRLTAQQREAAYVAVRQAAVMWRATAVSADEIDRVNILAATMLGMSRAVQRMDPPPDFVLVDGNKKPAVPCGCEAVVQGDGRSVSIAAASIIAKVARDRIMEVYDRRYPQYGFAQHKGYPTAAHRALLDVFGPSPIHRRSFRGKREREAGWPGAMDAGL